MFFMKKINKIILFAIILIIAFVLRFYNLGKIPDGLQQDETSIGYNAYSILKTGKDEHGVFLPQNFKAFGEYKLPGYIYASVLPIEAFGLNSFSIRFISALSGFISVIIVFFLTKTLVSFINTDKLFKNLSSDYIPFLTAFLLSINPWHLQFSRAAFEVMLANLLILFGVFLFIKGVESFKYIYITLSIIFFSLSIYTYNISRLFVPIFGLILIALFWKKIILFSRKIRLFFIILGFFCSLPFLLSIFSHGGGDSALGTLIFTSAKVQAPLQEFRSYFADNSFIFNKILFNYLTLTLWQYVNNIFAHLSVSYYFIGNSDGITNIGTNGQWYIFELPFVIWGIIWLFLKKNISSKIIFAWIISLICITSLTREPPQATRTFFLIFPITFCSGIGLYSFICKIKSLNNRYFRIFSFSFFILIASFYIFSYFASYYVRFPIFYAKNWRVGDRDVSLFIKNHQNEYEKIIFDKNSGFIYTSLLTYLSYSPIYFQNDSIWSKDDSEGFSTPSKFGKFEIRQIDWQKDLREPNVLIVTTADKKPQETAPLIAFFYPQRPIVINVGQDIMRFPISDISYVLVDTNNALRLKNK